MSDDERAELQAVATIAVGFLVQYANVENATDSEIRQYAWEFYDNLKQEHTERRRADLVPEGPNLRDAIDAGRKATDQSHQQSQK